MSSHLDTAPQKKLWLEAGIYGQHRALRLISGMLTHHSLHHALLFHGPNHSGKTTLARKLVQGLSCPDTYAPSPNTPTATATATATPTATGDHDISDASQYNVPSHTLHTLGCASCRMISEHRSPLMLEIASDDRIPVIHRLQQAILQPPSQEQSTALLQLLREECYRLIARHRYAVLIPLKRKKVSYPEGVVLSETQLEKHLNALYHACEQTQLTGDPHALCSTKSLEEIMIIQNSLDRTHISKAGISRALAWTEQSHAHSNSSLGGDTSKTLIIKGIEKIHPLTIGQFLKILEDPTPRTRFILIAQHTNTLSDGVAAPLLSRCFKISFQKLLHQHVTQILKEKFALTKPLHHELDLFFREAQSDQAYTSAKSYKLIVALLRNEKTSLSYLGYLAREYPQELASLPKDLLSVLATYLERTFLSPPATATASSMPDSAKENHYTKLAMLLQRRHLSQKKSLMLKNHIENCLRLKIMGVISQETLLIRIALFLRTWHT